MQYEGSAAQAQEQSRQGAAAAEENRRGAGRCVLLVGWQRGVPFREGHKEIEEARKRKRKTGLRVREKRRGEDLCHVSRSQTYPCSYTTGAPLSTCHTTPQRPQEERGSARGGRERERTRVRRKRERAHARAQKEARERAVPRGAEAAVASGLMGPRRRAATLQSAEDTSVLKRQMKSRVLRLCRALQAAFSAG